jgi:hypothetical protein
MGPKERGRKHMAVFVPNSVYEDIDPSTNDRLGTLFQVKGSPLAGFMHEIKSNWSRQDDTGIESVHLLCQAETQHAPNPQSPKPKILNQVALTVRPPGVSQPLWDAVSEFLSTRFNLSKLTKTQQSIFDCQDWVYDFIIRLSQRGIVDTAVLDVLCGLQDKKTALMRQPGSGSTATPLFTASMGRVVQPVANEITQPGPAPANRGRYTNSEWDIEHKGFKRYDQTAQKWEYRGADGVWRPSE